MSRIVIFANGVLSRPDLLRSRLRPTDRICCADGGTRHALELGLSTEAIIGDLDSLPPEQAAAMEAAGVALHRYPVDKDKTDLELALQWAIDQRPDEILLVTALGGRLDQMLANIFLLSRPEYAAVRLTLADGPQQATVLRANQTLTLSGQPGDRLSLVPLTPTALVTLTGVKWPLERATLSFGETLSISNELTARQATIKTGEGMILVVHFDK